MENRKSFGTFILQRRKELGLTQKEFAQQLFVTDSAVSKWERGLAYPDITLLQDICRVLQCSEKELLSASEDAEGRRAEQLAQKYLRLTRNYRLGQYILYGAIAAGCLLGNLLGQHTVSWFWIVLAAEAMLASLTLLPAFVPEGRRGAASLGGFTAALLLLLLVCCLYTGGDWFFMAAVSLLFGMGLVFLPFVLHALPLPPELACRKASVYVGTELLLLIALYGVSCLYTGGRWFLSATLWTIFGLGIVLLPPLLRQFPLPRGWRRHKALVFLSFESFLLVAGLAWEGRQGDFPFPMLPIALLCLTLPWGWLGAFRYLPLGRWLRTGAALLWTGLWVWLAPFFLDRVMLLCGWITNNPYDLHLPVHLTDWTDATTISANVMFLIILGFLLAGAVCLVIGFRRRPPAQGQE